MENLDVAIYIERFMYRLGLDKNITVSQLIEELSKEDADNV